MTSAKQEIKIEEEEIVALPPAAPRGRPKKSKKQISEIPETKESLEPIESK